MFCTSVLHSDYIMHWKTINLKPKTAHVICIEDYITQIQTILYRIWTESRLLGELGESFYCIDHWART